LSQFGFLAKGFTLTQFAPEEERKGHLGRRLSWPERKNGPSQKDKWAMEKKREKEGNKDKMKENK
jgi:hypothetical protein